MEAAHLSGKPGADLGLLEKGTRGPAEPGGGAGASLAERTDPRHRDAPVSEPPAFASVHLTVDGHLANIWFQHLVPPTLFWQRAARCRVLASSVNSSQSIHSVNVFVTMVQYISFCQNVFLFPAACFLGPCRGVAVVLGVHHNQSTEIKGSLGDSVAVVDLP